MPSLRWVWPILAGAVVGVVLRLIFSGNPEGILSAMSGAFIWLAPVLVGAATVYLAERRLRRGWGYYFSAAVLANVLFVLGTLLLYLEGWICAILIVPLFTVVGGLSGLLMGALCRWTSWPKPTVLSLAPLPLLLGVIEPLLPLPEHVDDVQRTVTIHAPATRVWSEILWARDIQPEEVRHGWIYRIGVPLPEYGIVEPVDDEFVRRIRMGKGIHFDQVVIDLQPERHIEFTYRFYDDSIPPDALDQHVTIGGKYFDLIGTAYSLVTNGDSTELTIRMRYRISTRFNWYAHPMARLLIGNFEHTILEFYRHRSELPGRDAATVRGSTSASRSARISP
jgi:hypothetical protein